MRQSFYPVKNAAGRLLQLDFKQSFFSRIRLSAEGRSAKQRQAQRRGAVGLHDAGSAPGRSGKIKRVAVEGRRGTTVYPTMRTTRSPIRPKSTACVATFRGTVNAVSWGAQCGSGRTSVKNNRIARRARSSARHGVFLESIRRGRRPGKGNNF